MDSKKTGELLGRCRERAGLTQLELAKKMYTTQSKVSMVESGERKISVTEMLEWVEITGQEDFFLKSLAEEMKATTFKKAYEYREEAAKYKQVVETMKKALVGVGA
ncbi:helix-turn-helix domain-containing protein [Effusibacillus dendaii]|uniref:HTH cro/C1-type domain-containing protein n=1 Tax=Effusibacillus dendaii TaxID=2743772 RepID=A0A7I8D8L8_9BACL|nr:helix-turn-helix transcriptional regulator [Effusibacillus dendaii]BCJ86493.1 hypothetical protein skT53_14780 [Effusibacillus dendaii]